MSRKSNITAIMSVPRIGFTSTFDCATNVTAQFGIPLKVSQGVFWGQKLEMGLEEAVRDGSDWVLTIDFDSIFLPEHLDEMFEIVKKNPDIDALAPVQMKRSLTHGKNCVLGSVAGKEIPFEELDHSKDTTEVDTAHFGFTLIKTYTLSRMPKPWLHSVPGRDGFWEKGEKIDDDIYFWKNFKQSGHNLHIANKVILGHLETFVIVPKESGLDYLNVYEYKDKQREYFKQRNS